MVIPCNVTQILHGLLLNIKTYSPEVSNIQRRETDSEKNPRFECVRVLCKTDFGFI